MADHPHDSTPADPLRVGGTLAVVAAIAFGITTPLIKRFGADAGPFATAGLLYAGASLASLVARPSNEAAIRRSHLGRLVAVALLGAVVAPVALAWGVQHASATTASLLLNFEVIFTVLLARAVFDEPIGERVVVAALLMVVGGALLVSERGDLLTGIAGLGALAVLAASLAWALDNTLTRPLADRDPTSVVLAKGALGSALSLVVATLTHERFPALIAGLALAACGAVGYGLSLRLYLQAQRRIGAARTGSIFAVGPFVGAVTAWALGDRGHAGVTLIAGVLFAIAIYLHLTEHHGHAHVHDADEHEHAHSHDDAHHDHTHDALPEGEHSHPHRHEPRVHTHPHGPDLHHRHRH